MPVGYPYQVRVFGYVYLPGYTVYMPAPGTAGVTTHGRCHAGVKWPVGLEHETIQG